MTGLICRALLRSTHKTRSKYQNAPRLQGFGDKATWAVACLQLDALSVTLVPTQLGAKQGETFKPVCDPSSDPTIGPKSRCGV